MIDGCPDDMQRAVGGIALTVRAGPRGTAVQDLAQSGNLRACFPHLRDGTLEAVILNTAGGVADGDRQDIDLRAGETTHMVVSTPSAERIYRARPGAAPARLRTSLRIASGARVDYLPQETILFDRCALDRVLTVELHPHATCLAVDSLVFGRQDSGETLTHLHLQDTIRLCRDGDLILHDAVRLRAPPGAAASAGGARAVATVLYASPDSASRLEGLRLALDSVPVEAGASVWNGLLIARLLASDARRLREAMVAVLSVLRPQGLPRVWSS